MALPGYREDGQIIIGGVADPHGSNYAGPREDMDVRIGSSGGSSSSGTTQTAVSNNTTTERPVTGTVDDSGIYRADGTIKTAGLRQNNATERRAGEAVENAFEYGKEMTSDNAVNQQTAKLNRLNGRLVSLQAAFQKDQKNGDLAKAINKTMKGIAAAEANLQVAQNNASADMAMGQQQMLATAMSDPASLIAKAKTPNLRPKGGLINRNVGQAGPAATVGSTAQAGFTGATMPSTFDAATYQAALASPAMSGVVNSIVANQGQLSPDDLIQAITMDPSALAQLNLTAAQISQAQQVSTPEQLAMQDGEMLSGSAVDWARVQEALDVEAARADPSKRATVVGQLEGLMQDFEGGDPPPWAAGAIRQAMADMLARGLGASSMAGAAVVQSAMEAAVPIARADAEIYAQFELTNLSNRQAVIMLGAQQRAAFLGQEFDQAFQAKVLNAARIGEIAQINHAAEVQVALENARLAQTVDLANLDARQAKVMADAAAMTQLDLTNLSHRQQAAVGNAQAFLAMDMANLDIRHQTEMMRSQLMAQAVLSDQAATNAALQFNAASENQVGMFFADLAGRVSMHNSSQANAISMFNAGQTNQVAMFNTQMINQRQEFNATNSLIVAQANAQWRQTVKLTKFAAKHESNMQAAKETNALTGAMLDAVLQRDRDIMQMAFLHSQNSSDRAVQLVLGDKQLEGVRIRAAADVNVANNQARANNQAGLGSFLGDLALGWLLPS